MHEGHRREFERAGSKLNREEVASAFRKIAAPKRFFSDFAAKDKLRSGSTTLLRVASDFLLGMQSAL
jgi:hypothetical protein